MWSKRATAIEEAWDWSMWSQWMAQWRARDLVQRDRDGSCLKILQQHGIHGIL